MTFLVPPEAPRVISQAVGVILAIPALLLVAFCIGLVNGASGGTLIVDVVIIALFSWLAWANGHGLQWARVLTIVVSALGALGSLGNVVLGGFYAVVGVISLLLYAAIIVLLLNGSAGPWYAHR